MTNNKTTQRYLDTLMRWHILGAENGGAFALGEVTLKPGDEPPLHIHAREDEAWYVLEGRIQFLRGFERIVCEAGESILLPRGVQHGCAVLSPSARILHLYTPAGIESAFQSLSSPLDQKPPVFSPEQITAAFEQRGVTFIGPPLPVLLATESRQE